MSKRLFDTEVWKKPWFYDLPDKYKLFWYYILSDCDVAGIWTANFKVVKAYLGEIDIEKIIESFKGQITILNGGTYWFINDFIKFQYGYPVSEKHKMKAKLSELLLQRNLNLDTLYDTVLIPYTIGYPEKKDTVKDIDKDKDKDKEEDIKEEGVLKFENWINETYPKFFKAKYPLTYDNCKKLIDRFGKKLVKDKFDAMHCKADFLKKYDDPYKVALNWLKKDNPEL